MEHPVNVGFRKSSYSLKQWDWRCVEVGTDDTSGRVFVRDSKNPAAGALGVTPAAWASFVRHVSAS